jgi:hypothetical protein
MKKIIIEIRGGVAVITHKSTGFKAIIVDWDNPSVDVMRRDEKAQEEGPIRDIEKMSINPTDEEKTFLEDYAREVLSK